MNTFFISDTHFGHEAIKKYSDRPDDFEKIILKNLHVVQKDDLLIHLGDVSFYKHEYWLKELCRACKGKIALVKGNHDSKSYNWYLKRGINMVAHGMTMKLQGDIYQLVHDPDHATPGIRCIHGHTHSRDIISPLHYPVCIEDTFKPITVRELLCTKMRF